MHTFPDLVRTHVNHNHWSVDARTPRTTRLNDIQQIHCGHKLTNHRGHKFTETTTITNHRGHKQSWSQTHCDHKPPRSQTIAITNHRDHKPSRNPRWLFRSIRDHKPSRNPRWVFRSIRDHKPSGNWNSVQSLFVGGNGNGNASLKQEWICRWQLVPETRAEPITIIPFPMLDQPQEIWEPRND